MTAVCNLLNVNEFEEVGCGDPATLDTLADILIQAHGVASQDQDPVVVMLIESALLRVGRLIARASVTRVLAS